MLKVSRRLNYGLQLMIALASQTETSSVPTAVISEKLQIPLPFLHQIAHTLMQSGLIKATPGPKGGLLIGKPASEISLLDIFQSLEGQLTIPSSDNNENDSEFVPEYEVAYEVWEDVGGRICNYFESITLASLAKKNKKKR